jgi:hypothetical protein
LGDSPAPAARVGVGYFGYAAFLACLNVVLVERFVGRPPEESHLQGSHGQVTRHPIGPLEL